MPTPFSFLNVYKFLLLFLLFLYMFFIIGYNMNSLSLLGYKQLLYLAPITQGILQVILPQSIITGYKPRKRVKFNKEEEEKEKNVFIFLFAKLLIGLVMTRILFHYIEDKEFHTKQYTLSKGKSEPHITSLYVAKYYQEYLIIGDLFHQ